MIYDVIFKGFKGLFIISLNNMLDEFNEVKYFKEVAYFKGLKRKNFKEIKRLKSLQVKTEAYSEPKRESTM